MIMLIYIILSLKIFTIGKKEVHIIHQQQVSSLNLGVSLNQNVSYVQIFLFLSALILNKNRLLLSLFKSYYLQYIENSVCLLFHYSSSLILILYAHVSYYNFLPLQGSDVGILLFIGNQQMIRQSVQYLIYTLVKYLLIQLIIIPRLEHFIGISINCLRQVGAPACTSN